MEKQSQRQEQKAQQAAKERIRGSPQKTGEHGAASQQLAPFYSVGAISKLPPKTALELAARIGNSAFLELLRGGREPLALYPGDLVQSESQPEVNGITPKMPALARPGGFAAEGAKPQPFEWNGLTGGLQSFPSDTGGE